MWHIQIPCHTTSHGLPWKNRHKYRPPLYLGRNDLKKNLWNQSTPWHGVARFLLYRLLKGALCAEGLRGFRFGDLNMVRRFMAVLPLCALAGVTLAIAIVF